MAAVTMSAEPGSAATSDEEAEEEGHSNSLLLFCRYHASFHSVFAVRKRSKEFPVRLYNARVSKTDMIWLRLTICMLQPSLDLPQHLWLKADKPAVKGLKLQPHVVVLFEGMDSPGVRSAYYAFLHDSAYYSAASLVEAVDIWQSGICVLAAVPSTCKCLLVIFTAWRVRHHKQI